MSENNNKVIKKITKRKVKVPTIASIRKYPNQSDKCSGCGSTTFSWDSRQEINMCENCKDTTFRLVYKTYGKAEFFLTQKDFDLYPNLSSWTHSQRHGYPDATMYRACELTDIFC